MTAESGNFFTNFMFLINQENFIDIWDKLIDIGLTPEGWLEGVSKYDALNDMVGEPDGRYLEIYINTQNRDCYFMLWWHDNNPHIEIKDTKEIVEELSLVNKYLYK